MDPMIFLPPSLAQVRRQCHVVCLTAPFSLNPQLNLFCFCLKSQVRNGDAVIAVMDVFKALGSTVIAVMDALESLRATVIMVVASLKARGSTPVARRLGGLSMAAYFQGDE